MTETSVFRGGLEFLDTIGIYDVVLPFLLTFTLVFALLEKTKILGVQEDPLSEDQTLYPKRNLNSMVSFVIAFFVVASSQLVALINKTVSSVFILILLAVMFMLVVGTFGKDEEFFFQNKTAFVVIMGIAIVIIFLDALGWLKIGYNFLKDYWSTEAVSAIIFIVLIAIFIWVIGGKPKSVSSTTKDNEE